jgi:hypothetical protein
MYELQQHIINLPPTVVPRVEARKHMTDCVYNRWKMMHNDLHAAGYALEPRFIDHDILGVEEVSFCEQ